MKQLVFCINNAAIEKTWVLAVGRAKYKVIETIAQSKYENPNDVIILIHHKDLVEDNKTVKELLQAQYTVILLADSPSIDKAIEWFSLGVKGYLNSQANPKRINQAIKTVASGNIWLGQAVMQAMIANSYEAKTDNEAWKNLITEREVNTVEHLLTGKTNKEIARLMNISERTVKAHFSSLFKKFNVKDRLALVLYIQNWQG